MSLVSKWNENVKKRKDQIFLIFHGESYTYEEFDRLTNSVANSLSAYGVGLGDRVGGFMENRQEWLVIYFALMKLGAINVFINTQYDSQLLKHALLTAGVSAVAVSENLLHVYDEIRRDITGIRVEIVIGEKELTQVADGNAKVPYKELLAGEGHAPPDPEIVWKTPLQFVYTSGTTGPPKPCVISNRWWASLTRSICRQLEITSSDRVFSCLPNYHGNVYVGIFCALMAGATAVVETKFSASQYWDLVRPAGIDSSPQ